MNWKKAYYISYSQSQLAELDTKVAVLGAGSFLKDFSLWDDLAERR